MNAEIQAYCENKVLQAGSPLQLTQLYVPVSQRPVVIAIHTVLVELMAIPETVSDVGVAEAKLAWWRDQLLRHESSANRHPALRALMAHRDLAILKKNTVDDFLNGLHRVVSRSSYQNIDELWADCQLIGTAAWQLEMQALSSGQQDGDLAAAGAAHYFIRSLFRLSHGDSIAPWPLPLSLQARHQINREQFRQGLAADANSDLKAAIKNLIQEGRQRITPLMSDSPPSSAVYAHTWVMSWFNQRYLRRLEKNPDFLFHSRGSPYGLWDAVALWRRARQLKNG